MSKHILQQEFPLPDSASTEEPTPRLPQSSAGKNSPKSFFKEVLQKIGHSPSGSNFTESQVGDFIDQTMNHL
jgi:hypothetical protein